MAPAEAMPLRVLAIASGKGGVGKTSVTANLAVALASRGLRVCAVDADLGLANLDVALGLTSTRTLLHVLRGEARVADVVVPGPGGIHVVPAASGFAELTRLPATQQRTLLDEMETLENDFDVLLLDVGAGISSNVLWFASAAAETLVVLTPEPTSLTDAYALVKLLATRHGRDDVQILVNMAAHAADAEAAYARLARVAARFLSVRLEYVGFVPFDDAVPRAVRAQQSVVLAAPRTPASLAICALAARIAAQPRVRARGETQFFFRRLLADADVAGRA